VDHIDALKTRALDAVLHPDHEAFLRHVFRWYSKNLATPYQDVFDIPLDEVLQTYFEGTYEQLPHEKLIEEARELSMTDEEKKAHQRWLEEEAAADVLFEKENEELAKQQMREKAIRDAREAEAERRKEAANPQRMVVKRGKIPELEVDLEKPARPAATKPQEASLPTPSEELPDIQMSFGSISDAELEEAGGLKPPEE
jgi:hypothetical protein